MSTILSICNTAVRKYGMPHSILISTFAPTASMDETVVRERSWRPPRMIVGTNSLFWVGEESEIKCRTIIDLIQQRCLLLFYIRITFCAQNVIHVVMENVSATNKCISHNFHFESTPYALYLALFI